MQPSVTLKKNLTKNTERPSFEELREMERSLFYQRAHEKLYVKKYENALDKLSDIRKDKYFLSQHPDLEAARRHQVDCKVCEIAKK